MRQGQDNKPRDRKFALLRGKPSDFAWLATGHAFGFYHVGTLTDFIRSISVDRISNIWVQF